jgi:hypothetical protein
MKKKLLLSLLLLISLSSLRGQIIFVNQTFNMNWGLPSYFTIDTTQANNLWQLGKPQKVFFDSAYSPPHALVTDTVNLFPAGNTSSFIIRFDFGKILRDCHVGFRHKYDFDSLVAGGYIEIRYYGWIESGPNDPVWTDWVNVQEDPLTWIGAPVYTSDTIIGGIPAFTGKSDGWKYTQLNYHWNMAIKGPMNFPEIVEYRFTAFSDSSATATEGWIIDDFFLYAQEYIGAIDEPDSQLFGSTPAPNPCHESITIVPNEPLHEDVEVFVFGSTGVLVEQFNLLAGAPLLLNSYKYSTGLFSYRLLTSSGKTSAGRFVKI